MLRMCGDDTQRLRRRTEQDIVRHDLFLERYGGDQLRHGEHDVEIGHVEQFRVTVFEPLCPRQTLALRAVTISARAVADALVAAVVAALNIPAQSSGAATLDRSHGTPPL